MKTTCSQLTRFASVIIFVASSGIGTARAEWVDRQSTACLLRKASQNQIQATKLGGFKFDEFAPHHMWFGKDAGDQRDDVLYDRKTDNLNFDGYYRITKESNTWHFRFGGQAFNSDGSKRTLLYDVQWVDGAYPGTAGTYEVEVIGLDTKASATNTLAMVGDSITWWQKGEYFRCRLVDAGVGQTFVGFRTDVFGYGHEGEGGNNSTHVLSRIREIVPSDTYFLLVGTNDRISPEQTVENILLIARRLHSKRAGSIVLVSTLLPRGDKFGKRNSRTNALLARSIPHCGYCRLIDLGGEFSALRWRRLLDRDGLHPNEDGYRALAKILAPKLVKYSRRP